MTVLLQLLRRSHRAAVAAMLLLTGCAQSSGAPRAISNPPPAQTPVASPGEEPDIPVPRTVEQPWMSLREWRARHQAQVEATGRADARVVLVGDSITQMWADTEAYRRLAVYSPLNLGIGGDQTQHVLWRLEHGSLAGTSPKVVVVLIGINNLGNGHDPAQTARGILAVVSEVHDRLPDALVLLLGILPSGALPSDPMRQRVTETNRLLASASLPKGARFHDVGNVFVEPDGRILSTIMADGLHPTPRGFALLTREVLPLIEHALANDHRP